MAKIYTLEPVNKYQPHEFAHLAFEKQEDIPKELMKQDGVIKAQFNSVLDYLVEIIWLNDERSDYYIEEKELIKHE